MTAYPVEQKTRFMSHKNNNNRGCLNAPIILKTMKKFEASLITIAWLFVATCSTNMLIILAKEITNFGQLIVMGILFLFIGSLMYAVSYIIYGLWVNCLTRSGESKK